MDSKDRDIIAALQADGRMSNQDLSERVNLSPSPCLRRLRALEDEGVIRGYTAIVDEEIYGLPVTAFVRVRIQVHAQESVNAFEDAIRAMDSVLDCYVMTGDADYLLRVLVSSLRDYERFVREKLHKVPGVASIDTSFAYGQIKKSNVFPPMS
ncbi:Lrp/AsnC family transcriptional regulator [Sphingomonas populi]|uniref:Lrp/AsnC family transcriptional regulator n=1 Tax=Sphingomonas populi TaxID=2484750 RepID=A0A4Q6XVC1_9SPHN|nr:Lrp/AsnC family transcriptional regulator [Sphingomonas populi]RZF60617.1 Lrp/AsnC family transcriptional regulator [Sphingomonas populi]